MVEEKEEKKGIEVTIIDRATYLISPRLGVEQTMVDVTYLYADRPPRTITISMPEIDPKAIDEFKTQLLAGTGPLFETYFKKEKVKIREDIEKWKPPAPVTITI